MVAGATPAAENRAIPATISEFVPKSVWIFDDNMIAR